MSRIFEALQRSESERAGTEFLVPPETLADLLRAEQNTTTVRESGASSDFSSARVIVPAPAADSRLVCLTDQGSLGSEKFRVLGLRLRNMREKRRLKRVVVTSTIPEEGKSLISANLALNQSRSKILKTVLIDGDLRRPALAPRFGFRRELPGLSECLRGEAQLQDVIYRLQGTGLWFIPAGITPENPIELMQSGKLAEIFEQLESFFEWIIIDSPPILPLADTPLWIKVSDGTLLVTREGVCERNLLKRAVQALDPQKMLGVVINGCSTSEEKYYYSRYSPEATEPQEMAAKPTES